MKDSERKEINKLCSLVCECGHKFNFAETLTNWSRKFVSCKCGRSGWVERDWFTCKYLDEPVRSIEGPPPGKSRSPSY